MTPAVAELDARLARLVEAHRHSFGRLPFQACRVRFERRLDLYLPTARRSPQARLGAELKARVRGVLYAPGPEDAKRRLRALTAGRDRFGGIGACEVIGSLERNVGFYTAHYHVPDLPADNRVTEHVIKQLNKKLHLMEGFPSVESAESFARQLVGCYRVARMTDSSRGEHNGASPVGRAGADLTGVDWLRFLLNR